MTSSTQDDPLGSLRPDAAGPTVNRQPSRESARTGRSLLSRTILRPESSARFYLVLTIILWSAVPATAKIGLRELDNFQLLFYTALLGVVSLSGVVIVQKKLRILFGYSRTDYLRMLGMGFLGIYLYNVLLYKSYSLAPAGQVNVVNYLWPVFIVVFSILILRETLSYQTALSMAISFLGAVVSYTGGNPLAFHNDYALGYGLAGAGAVCYGLFSVLGKKLEYDKVTSMLVYYVVGFVLIVPTVLTVSRITIPHATSTFVAVILLGGVMNSLAYVFWFKALKLGHTHKTANYIYAVPFLAMLWTRLLNGEALSASSVVGLCFIITGITIQMRQKA